MLDWYGVQEAAARAKSESERQRVMAQVSTVAKARAHVRGISVKGSMSEMSRKSSMSLRSCVGL